MACLLLSGRNQLCDVAHHDGPRIRLLGEAADQLELGIRAVAAHLEIDPMARPADMLAESFVEFFGVRRRARRKLAVEDPRRPMWVDLTHRDLVQQIEQIGGIRRIGATPPELSDRATKFVGQREQTIAGLSPTRGSLGALLVFALLPPDVPAGHFFVDTMLSRSDHVREERQRLAFETLLALEGCVFARRVPIGFRSGPGTEPHQAPFPRFALAALERMRMAAVMLPVPRAASA